ncbi:MAG TPA: hypothetical protein VFC79_00555, partial [Tissierellaceae bacterium]|nr:hypothetical protein [Tissierellaceae bacterium]
MSIDSDGEIITSNKLEFSVISIEAGNNTAIIASTFTTAEATQFDTIVIPFTVYNPLSVNTDIDMIVNEEVIQSRVVDRMQQYWSVNLTESGSITLQIKAGSVSKFFYVEVAESNIADIEETEGLELKLISEGRSNAESNRDSWEYLDIKSLFNNFNWTSNGWAMDSNGNSYLKVSGDAKLEIPFKIFDTDFKLDGKTIEIQFFTEDVSNLDYVVLSCMQGGKGFEITSQKVTFKSEQSTITTQFKENELIKVSISVEQSAKNRLLSLFINGILSGVLQYPTTDNFIQSIPANITAQGAEATIGIYTIRVYKTDLQPWQILNNYIFDYPVARERELIYMRNNILGADGNISYARLVEQLPC